MKFKKNICHFRLSQLNKFSEYKPFFQIVFWIVFSSFVINYLIGQSNQFGIPFTLFISAGFIQWAPFYFAQKRINDIEKNNKKSITAMDICNYALPIYYISNFCYIIILLALGYAWTIYMFQYLYYIVCYTFLFYFYFHYLTFLAKRYRIVNNISNVLLICSLWISPIFWAYRSVPQSSLYPYLTILKLNPLTYIIIGIQNTIVNRIWFFETPNYNFYFWISILAMFIVWRILLRKEKVE